jgi:hypothetical protein
MQEVVKQLEQSYRNGTLYNLGFLSDPIGASLRIEPLVRQILSKVCYPVSDKSDPLCRPVQAVPDDNSLYNQLQISS